MARVEKEEEGKGCKMENVEEGEGRNYDNRKGDRTRFFAGLRVCSGTLPRLQFRKKRQYNLMFSPFSPKHYVNDSHCCNRMHVLFKTSECLFPRHFFLFLWTWVAILAMFDHGVIES